MDFLTHPKNLEVSHSVEYTYAPLSDDSNEIRLLLISSKEIARQSGYKGQILCRLNQYNINDAPEYNALSYTWGDTNDRRHIWINDTVMSVTKNLYDFLTTIQHETKICVFWIDAVCINQADDLEKSYQVAMMHQIYKNAVSVTAWLGPEDDGSDIAIQSFIDIAIDFNKMLGKGSAYPDKYIREHIDVSDSGKPPFPIRESIHFLSRPFVSFQRLQQS
jgi:hypothetical protein